MKLVVLITLLFLLSQSDIRIYVDVEDADIESLDKNGITGYFFEKTI